MKTEDIRIIGIIIAILGFVITIVSYFYWHNLVIAQYLGLGLICAGGVLLWIISVKK